MSRLELSITPDYVPEWGLWEGLREIVQNAVDGQTEMGFKMTIHHTAGKTLVVANQGGSLPREALLIGFSTKRGKVDLIGKYGEGFKLGILALVRAGYEVTIRNGRETWVPSLEQSDKFNSKVLVFKISKAQNDCEGLKVMVKGVDEECWNQFQNKFIFLRAKTNETKTYAGSILWDESDKGSVYVKGIFVQKSEKLAFGYNLADAEVDRDRRMLASYELTAKTAQVWGLALQSNPDLMSQVFDLLEDGTVDLEDMVYNVTEDQREKMYTMFIEKYGVNAFPVCNFSQAQQLAHYGAHGIVVSEKIISVLRRKCGDFEAKLKSMSESSFTLVSPDGLDVTETRNLETAIAALSLVESSFSRENVNICDFMDGNKLGQCSAGKILLSRKILASVSKTIEVLIHEFCHPAGKDGEKGFTDRVAEVSASIIAVLV